MSNKVPVLDISFHEKQLVAFNSEAREILYGGAAGGGKSFLFRMASFIWASQIPDLQIYLFRTVFEDIVANHMEGESGYRAILNPWVDAGFIEMVEDEVRFWNGSRIYLSFCNHDKHLEKYRGREMHVLGIEEATQFDESWIRFLRHRVRMSREMKFRLPDWAKGRFPRILYTSNPGGISHHYFRTQFVVAAPEYEIWQSADEEGGFTRQYIPAKLEDNPSLDEVEYRRALRGVGDAETVKALEHGDWSAIVGNFLSEYDDTRHTTPDFSPPSYWFKFLTFDWGSAEPFAVLWWCVSDGKEFTDHEGRRRWFPRGALIAYREWYGANVKRSNEGLRLSNTQMAMQIRERTKEQVSGLVIADGAPFADRGGICIADDFFEAGLPLTRGDDSRIAGWAQVKGRLIGKEDWPMIFFTQSCTYTRGFLPVLQRKKDNRDDAVDDGEATHLTDAVRYACNARPLVKDAPIDHYAKNAESNKMTFDKVRQKLEQRGRLQRHRFGN